MAYSGNGTVLGEEVFRLRRVEGGEGEDDEEEGWTHFSDTHIQTKSRVLVSCMTSPRVHDKPTSA